ncbi:SDR family NAD(P)-dependent oxidoreductase [Paenibacillus senegalensis]|uniref:SDR family NAD(P)-dependent oxidoreductase n=1 Tax=Paenibacillus senegalensis TaxID=1465766 RepID=UPI0002880F2C|nr:SDR family NAD(P)-dependent oxidoreductase [Paenibacillus senegalensis]
MRLKSKAVLLTGGSQGIGQAIALKFVREGARLAIADREVKALEETVSLLRAEGGEVLPIEADLQDKVQLDRMIDASLEAFGGIDVLVNNAGICRPAPLLEISEEDWDQHLTINLKAPFLASQRMAREWIESGKTGTIVNTSSVNGIQAEANQAHYNASKGGLNLLTMSLALELAQSGIRVNAVCPGFIETRLTRPAIQNEAVITEYLKSVPMGRVGQPDEIADVVLFLASEESRYITGHCLVVDGGQVIKLS